ASPSVALGCRALAAVLVGRQAVPLGPSRLSGPLCPCLPWPPGAAPRCAPPWWHPGRRPGPVFGLVSLFRELPG
ncbi:hypothetical protein, partial [Streptomyces sp. FH025]|uniref:hypothetical protein n=1 Tax=Streptomyces sp. FH025 TaxID=2815937 RepID=UPI001A9CF62F